MTKTHSAAGRPTTAALDDVFARLAEREPDAVRRLCDWLAMASVGTDPTHDADTRRAAEWTRDRLAEAGFDAEIVETGDPAAGVRGQPAVLATASGEADYRGPHAFFYGHYDVQPADPIDLWQSPPFEPKVFDEGDGGPARIVARGASDDKGQVAMFLEAMRAWHDVTGKPAGGCRMTVLIEGEEESGSVNLERLLKARKAQLERCDVCVISDTGMLARGRPAITYGVRGLVYVEVTVTGPDQDLHSGLWGGSVPNPLNELTRILAQLHDDRRRVTIPAFYEGVRGPTEAEHDEWNALGIDEPALLERIGLPPEGGVGEAGFNLVARQWARPTCDINGVVGGYTGPGAKTVIPSKATAKLSFRLVDDQDSVRIRDAVYSWFRERTPPGCRLELIDHGAGPGATLPVDSPELRAAARAIERACGTPPAMIKSGGSIPVAGLLKERLGLDTVFMGFGLDDDRIHSPNEKFELECFRQGARSHAALIAEWWGMSRVAE